MEQRRCTGRQASTARCSTWFKKTRSIRNNVQQQFVVDSHIQRVVLATEETTVTQQVSHRHLLSNANPACGHKEVRRSTGHIMVTTRYSDQQGSKSRQKVMRLYKQWHRAISKRSNIIESNLDQLGLLPPTHDQRSQQKNGKFVVMELVVLNQVVMCVWPYVVRCALARSLTTT